MIDESTASVAVEEEAASTSADSPTATEGASSKDGEKSAEKPPVEGKSSQDKSPSTDDSKDDEEPKDGIVNIHAYKRIKQERNEIRTTLNGLSELGIKSKADAELLLKDAEISETEAVERGRINFVRWMTEDPIAFGVDFHKNHPEQYQVIATKAAAQALHARSQELQESNPELAAELLELARVYHGEGKANGHRAPKAPDPATRELTSVREEKQLVFDHSASAEISTAFRSTIDLQSKGFAFTSELQKKGFHRDVVDAINDSLDRNRVFTNERNRLEDVRNLPLSQLDGRRAQVVQHWLKHASDPVLLKRIISEQREARGLRITDPPANGKVRTEVNGSSAPISGKLTQDDKDRIFSDLEQQGYSGSKLTEKYANALSKARLGA